MVTVQLNGSVFFDSQMSMHIFTGKNYMSLSMDFQKHLSRESRKHGTIVHQKYNK